VAKVRDNWRLLLARSARGGDHVTGPGAVTGNPLVAFPGTVSALF